MWRKAALRTGEATVVPSWEWVWCHVCPLARLMRQVWEAIVGGWEYGIFSLKTYCCDWSLKRLLVCLIQTIDRSNTCLVMEHKPRSLMACGDFSPSPFFGRWTFPMGLAVGVRGLHSPGCALPALAVLPYWEEMVLATASWPHSMGTEKIWGISALRKGWNGSGSKNYFLRMSFWATCKLSIRQITCCPCFHVPPRVIRVWHQGRTTLQLRDPALFLQGRQADGRWWAPHDQRAVAGWALPPGCCGSSSLSRWPGAASGC